jgi:hypothetical protein
METGSRLGSWSWRAALIAVALACVARLASGCDPLGNLDLWGGGGGGSSACPSPFSPDGSQDQAGQVLCQKLEQCFPQVFAASYGDASMCETSFWYGLLGCPPSSQCLTDLMSTPCPACLAPPTQSGTAVISSPTAFLPQSCQTASTSQMLAGFGNLDVEDAACANDAEPAATVDAETPEVDGGTLEAEAAEAAPG